MNDDKQAKQPSKAPAAIAGMAALVALVGAGAADLLIDRTPKYEGVRLVGYYDPAHIPTKCMGDTQNVVIGKKYTIAECQQSMVRQLAAHAGPAVKCAPTIKGNALVTWAAGDYAYNAGVGRFCNNLVRNGRVVRIAPATYFKKGQMEAGCRALATPTTAGGRVLNGLVTRRHDEVSTCLEGLKK